MRPEELDKKAGREYGRRGKVEEIKDKGRGKKEARGTTVRIKQLATVKMRRNGMEFKVQRKYNPQSMRN